MQDLIDAEQPMPLHIATNRHFIRPAKTKMSVIVKMELRTLDYHIRVHWLQRRRHKCVNSLPTQTIVPTGHPLTEVSNLATCTSPRSTTAISPTYSYVNHLIYLIIYQLNNILIT